jgi:hypothetical protein
MLTNLIIVLIITAIIIGAAAKLAIDKKKGGHCSSCPYSGLSRQECSCDNHRTAD